MNSKIIALPIDEIKKEISKMHSHIQNTYFIPFFKSLKGKYSSHFKNEKSPKIIVRQISSLIDLEEIPNERGFYLIFTDYKNGYEDLNDCTCVISDDSNARVIYRGESYNVRTRLESHLFNNYYHKKRKENHKRIDNYQVCLKLMNEEHVNLDSSVENHTEIINANWYVAYHAFPKSDGVIRKMAEQAFDEIFGKPVCSRENRL